MASTHDESIRDDFITVLGWMIEDLGLNGKELLVYALFYGFTRKGMGNFVGTQTYIGKWVGCSRRTVNEVIKNLVDNGLVEKKQFSKNGVVYCEYSAVKPDARNFTPCEETSHNDEKKLLTPCEETSQHISIDKDIDNNIPPNTPQKETENGLANKQKSSKKKGTLSIDDMKEEIAKRSFSSAIVSELYDWIEYKGQIKNQYTSVMGFNRVLTELENAIKKHGEKAVIERIDESMSREWQGWYFNTMDAFDKNRPYMQNRQKLETRSRYKDLSQKPDDTEQRKQFQELARNLRESLKNRQE